MRNSYRDLRVLLKELTNQLLIFNRPSKCSRPQLKLNGPPLSIDGHFPHVIVKIAPCKVWSNKHCGEFLTASNAKRT